MFGLVRPCRHTMTQANRESYRAHMCGACLGIRDELGQAARIALNRDALVLSVLAEHIGAPLERAFAGRCPLRGMRTAEVIDPQIPIAKYVGAVSLILIEASINDHAEDADRGKVVARMLQRRVQFYGDKARSLSHELGVDLSAIERCVRQEREVRGRSGLTTEEYLRYTQEAFGLGFAGVATVLKSPEVGDRLADLGQAYGATAAFVDCLEDYDDDVARGEFNIMAASWPSASRSELAARAGDALSEYRTLIVNSLSSLNIHPGDLAWDLLVHSLSQRATKALASFSGKGNDRTRSSGGRTLLGIIGLASLLASGIEDDCWDACCETCCEGMCDCD